MSNTSVLEPASTGPSRAASGLIGLLLLGALIFVAGSALPYFAYTEERFGPYWFERGWLMAHIMGGMVAVLAGPVQLWLGLSDRRMGLHRVLGITYVCGVAVGAVGAFYLATHTPFGWVYGAGLAGLAATWIVTTGLAYAAIRRSLYEQHKEWMIRSYVVTFAFVTFRALQPLVAKTGVGTQLEQIAFLSWVCWTIPLMVTEAVIQGRKIFAVR